MKKIFAMLLALTLLCSVIVIPVSAESVAVSSAWTKFMAENEITVSEENGETVYSYGGITKAYTSAGVDIMPELKKLIEGNDKITVAISVDIKIDYNEDFEGEDLTLGAMVRARDVHKNIKEPDAFKSLYRDEGVGAFYDTGGGNYAIRVWENEVVADEWVTLEGEATFTATDINGGLWGSINFCFDRMTYEVCKTMYIKNTKIELVDYEEGDGEILIDLNQAVVTPENGGNAGTSSGSVDTSSLDLTANADAEDTPELPENNYLTAKWTKGYASSEPIEGTFKDQAMYSMTNWKSAYSSPFLDILPAVKEAMGDEDEVTVYIVFDIRALNYKGMEGETHPFGIKIRPKTTDLTKTKEAFEENYLAATFSHHGEGDVRLTILGSGKKEISEDWQRIEIMCTFFSEDVEDGLWEAWNLCFDNVSTFKELGAIQIKNMGIFMQEEYEPVNKEEDKKPTVDTENKPATKPESSLEPVVIHKPIGGGRYNINFMESVETIVEGGLIDNTSNIDVNGEQNNEDQNSGDNTITIIVIAASAVIVIAAAVVILIISKKKKSQKEDK